MLLPTLIFLETSGDTAGYMPAPTGVRAVRKTLYRQHFDSMLLTVRRHSAFFDST